MTIGDGTNLRGCNLTPEEIAAQEPAPAKPTYSDTLENYDRVASEDAVCALRRLTYAGMIKEAERFHGCIPEGGLKTVDDVARVLQAWATASR